MIHIVILLYCIYLLYKFICWFFHWLYDSICRPFNKSEKQIPKADFETENKKKELEEEQRKRKELEELLKIQKEQQRKHKEQEDQQKKEKEENLRKKRIQLEAAESNTWPMVKGVHHYFFYYYYPIRFDDVTELDWNVRNLIWNFKDGRSHNKVSQLLTIKLHRVYREALDLLTFVCIPASTREVNHKRYYSFMTDVCNETGMANGYEYITIIKETEPTHLGGTTSVKYACDKDFFNGRRIILFDDVVTRGRSIAKMKAELENVGAQVIAALSIGYTYSDYYGDNREQHPWLAER